MAFTCRDNLEKNPTLDVRDIRMPILVEFIDEPDVSPGSVDDIHELTAFEHLMRPMRRRIMCADEF
jgi:hypothetical protein